MATTSFVYLHSYLKHGHSIPKINSLILSFLILLFILSDECFGWMCTHALQHVCLVLVEGRRGHQISWNLSFRWLLCRYWESNPGPLQQHLVPLSTEPSLQSPKMNILQ